MAVTDEQMAALRAYLAGDFETHTRLRSQLDREAAATSYSALISAAFCVAVLRRFSQDHGVAVVIDFVSTVRSQSEWLSDNIDPRVAERLIQSVFTYEKVSDINQEIRFGTQIVLLAALIADEHLDGPGLDEFMTESRKLADGWLR
jgi:alkylhydroperoxidase family enzyme